jgi:integrase
VRVEHGAYLGFRKATTANTGTWIARFRDATSGKQQYEALGEFADSPAHQRFDRAAKAAREWFVHLGRGGRTDDTTVEQACLAYVQHLGNAGRATAAKDASYRFQRWINGTAFGSRQLQKLTPSDVNAWRVLLAKTPARPQDKTVKPTRARAPSSLNRDMTSLRAALNLALEHGHVTTDFAWKSRLRPIKDADGQRDVYLDIEQRKALIAKAPPDLANFIRALSLVPLRPGAMAALSVRSFDQRLTTLTIGKDKGGHERKITLPASTAAFFASFCEDREPEWPLLARADGKRWDKDAWKHPMKAAVRAAGLPDNITAYALRHSTITDLIARHKLDTLTVAQLSGTSLAMIEKHYGHLLRDHAAKALEALAL